jgi:hypothetical protein
MHALCSARSGNGSVKRGAVPDTLREEKLDVVERRRSGGLEP